MPEQVQRKPKRRGRVLTVTFKCPHELVEGLDELAARVPVNGQPLARSQVIRYILRRAINQPQMQAAFEEELIFFTHDILSKISKVQRCVRKALQDEVTNQFQLQLSSGERDDEEEEDDIEDAEVDE